MFSWDDLSDAALTELCNANATVAATDPNCSCLMSGGGPELNTDVSGPGVRISFYLQALFLAVFAARSGSLEDISGALYTLIATNVSMATTSLILGFKTDRGMSLHDAIVVFYLLSGSWLAIFFSLPSYNRFVKSDSTLQALTIAHSYLIFAFVLAVLVTARTFGMTPRCNSHAIGVMFFHFPALDAGRIAAFVFAGLVICTYSFISLSDYYRVASDWYNRRKKEQKEAHERKAQEDAKLAALPTNTTGALIRLSKQLSDIDIERNIVDPEPSRSTFASSRHANLKIGFGEKYPTKAQRRKAKRKGKEGYFSKPPGVVPKTHSQGEHSVFVTGVLGSLVIEIFVIVVLWSLFVMNTELLILWNHFEGGGDGRSSDLWGFGQILPMFLVLLPFVQLAKAFKKWGLRRREHRTRKHRQGLSAEERAAKRTRRHGHMHGNGEAWTLSSFPRWAGISAYTYGNQPPAHISMNSIHTAEPEPEAIVRQKEGRRMRYGHDDSSRSLSHDSTSSSDSRMDSYAPDPGENVEKPSESVGGPLILSHLTVG